MSNTKTRFQQSAISGKNSNSKQFGANSKRAGVNPISGFGATGNKSNTNPQVLFNGKILTPHKLTASKATEIGNNTLQSKKLQTVTEKLADENNLEDKSVVSKLTSKKNDTDLTAKSIKTFGNLAKQKSQIEESCSVLLTETSTEILFSIPSLIVSTETRDVIAVDERNARYDVLVKNHKNEDGFVSRPTQTKNNPLKHQNEMASLNAYRDFGSQVVAYEINDAITNINYQKNNENDGVTNDQSTMDDLSRLDGNVRKYVKDTVNVSLVTPGCLLEINCVIKPSTSGKTEHSNSKFRSEKQRSKSSIVIHNNKSTTGSGANAVATQSSGDDYNYSNYNSIEIQNSDSLTPAAVHATSSSVVDIQQQHYVQNNSNAISSTIQKQHKAAASHVSGVSRDSAAGYLLNIGTTQPSGSKIISNDDHEHSEASGNASTTNNNNNNNNATHTEEDSLAIVRAAEITKLLSDPMLLKRLHMIERAIQQNAAHRSQLDYRDLPDIKPLNLFSNEKVRVIGNQEQLFGGLGNANAMYGEKEKKKNNNNTSNNSNGLMMMMSPLKKAASSNVDFEKKRKAKSNLTENNSSYNNSNHKNNLFGDDDELDGGESRHGTDEKFKKLFSYTCHEVVQGRPVNAMVWNTASTDLLAVGYGRTENFIDVFKAGEALNEEKHGGLVLFWSLRNPNYPEKILKTMYPVTALDFSKLNPMVLAVGFSNGDVSIYDVRREGANWGIPVESSLNVQGLHGISGHSDPVWY